MSPGYAHLTCALLGAAAAGRLYPNLYIAATLRAMRLRLESIISQSPKEKKYGQNDRSTFVGPCHDTRDPISQSLRAGRLVGMRSRCPGDGVDHDNRSEKVS